MRSPSCFILAPTGAGIGELVALVEDAGWVVATALSSAMVCSGCRASPCPAKQFAIAQMVGQLGRTGDERFQH